MVVCSCGALFAVSHLDFTRDVGVAYQIANGERWPLQGRVLNWNLHLGPIWYYLLAVPLRLTHSWLAIVLTVALLAALKFPLAYALGARLVDPLCGVLWALLLALPGWNSFDAILIEHTSLVATCVLAFSWMLVRYTETGAARYLYGVALLYSLSLHAHPSSMRSRSSRCPFCCGAGGRASASGERCEALRKTTFYTDWKAKYGDEAWGKLEATTGKLT